MSHIPNLKSNQQTRQMNRSSLDDLDRASAPRCDFRVFRRGGRWSWKCGRSGSGSCSATPPPLLLWRHRRCTRCCTLPLLRVPHPLPRPDVQLRCSPPLSLSAERRSSLPLPRRRRLRWPRRRGTARPEADEGSDGWAGGGEGRARAYRSLKMAPLPPGWSPAGRSGSGEGRRTEDGGRTEKKGRLSSLVYALSVPLASF